MAQLGDTTVIGDLSVTGKVWGEGNRVYIPDYNTFDPTKLNMQVGEMITVYNDLIDPTKSHAPWDHTSAGYLIRNNNEAAGSANSTYTLMIHNSSAGAEFATRVWIANAWQDWVIGGTGSTTTDEKNPIYYWDGTNDNTFFQKVLDDHNKNKDVVILSRFGYDTAWTNPDILPYIFVFSKTLTPISNQYKLCSNPVASKIDRSDATSDGTTVIANKYLDIYITVNSSNTTVTKVLHQWTTSAGNQNLYAKVLDTEVNYQKPYVPKYDGSPATKKYVDDNMPDVFYWDGKSSTTNTNNVALWNKIITKAKTKTVLVYASDESSTSDTKKSTFIINPADVKTTAGSSRLYSIPTYVGTQIENSKGGSVLSYRAMVSLTYSGSPLAITANTSISTNSVKSSTYLPTNSTSVTSYTPTYNYHPATKKYVDDYLYSGGEVDLSINALPTNNYGYVINSAPGVIIVDADPLNFSYSNEVTLDFDDISSISGRTKLIIDIDNSNYTMQESSGEYLIMADGEQIASTGDTHVEYIEGKFSSTQLIISSFPATPGIDTISFSIKRLIEKTQYIPVNNTIEYVPSDKYNPATKDYVDSLVYKTIGLSNITATGFTKGTAGATDYYTSSSSNGEITFTIPSNVSSINVLMSGYLPTSNDWVIIYKHEKDDIPVMGEEVGRISGDTPSVSAQSGYFEDETISIPISTLDYGKSITLYSNLSTSSGAENVVLVISAVPSGGDRDQFISATSQTDNGYSPTNPWDPATKRYVDQVAVKSPDGSITNWITLTKEQFEVAKTDGTIDSLPDGTVINVLDDEDSISVGLVTTQKTSKTCELPLDIT